MKQYSLIENGVIKDVIDANDETFALTNHDSDIVLDGKYPIGYLFENSRLVPPQVIDLEDENFVKTTAYLQSQGVDTATKFFIVITSAKVDGTELSDDYRIKLPIGSATEITFELRDETDQLVPLSGPDGHFAVPLQRLKGEVIDSIGVQFTNGVATFTRTWDKSGEFVITEETLNSHIDNLLQKFVFKGLAFSVYS